MDTRIAFRLLLILIKPEINAVIASLSLQTKAADPITTAYFQPSR